MSLLLIDDFSPRTVGNLGNPLTVTFTDHIINPLTNQVTPYDLTGLIGTAFHLLIKNMSTQIEVAGLGTWSVIDALNGRAQYAWNAADVANAGVFGIRATVQFTSGLVTFESRILQFLV